MVCGFGHWVDSAQACAKFAIFCGWLDLRMDIGFDLMGGESSDYRPSSMDPTKLDSQIRLDLSLFPGGEHRLRWGGFQGEGRGQSPDGGIPPHPL